MQIKFKIEEVWPQDRLVVARFYTDAFPEGSRTAITIYPDPMPTGDELRDYIMSYAPTAWLLVKDRIAVNGAEPHTEMEAMKDAATEVARDVDVDGFIIPVSQKYLDDYNRRKQLIPAESI